MKIIKTNRVKQLLKILKTWRINYFIGRDGVYIRDDDRLNVVIKELMRKGIEFRIINQFDITEALRS